MKRAERFPEPEGGSLLRLFNGTYHAFPYDETMLDGDFATFENFQQAGERLGFYKSIAAYSFNTAYTYLLKKTEYDEGVPRKKELYGQYLNWADAFSLHRPHILIAGRALQMVSQALHSEVNPEWAQQSPQRLQVMDDVLEHLPEVERSSVN